jgi:hypothetical protein
VSAVFHSEAGRGSNPTQKMSLKDEPVQCFTHSGYIAGAVVRHTNILSGPEAHSDFLPWPPRRLDNQVIRD